MTILTLEDIQKNANDLSCIINAPLDLLPTYGYSRDGAYPHIEVDQEGLLHYVTVERGQEIDRKTTRDLDKLLYWIFAGVTFSMALNYELKNRNDAMDSRRLMFEKQEELLGMLSDKWRQYEQEEHKNILVKFPFDDLAGLRAIFCGRLRRDGYAESAIDKLANEKYPAIEQ